MACCRGHRLAALSAPRTPTALSTAVLYREREAQCKARLTGYCFLPSDHHPGIAHRARRLLTCSVRSKSIVYCLLYCSLLYCVYSSYMETSGGIRPCWLTPPGPRACQQPTARCPAPAVAFNKRPLSVLFVLVILLNFTTWGVIRGHVFCRYECQMSLHLDVIASLGRLAGWYSKSPTLGSSRFESEQGTAHKLLGKG